jgi:hypothetical protein
MVSVAARHARTCREKRRPKMMMIMFDMVNSWTFCLL